MTRIAIFGLGYVGTASLAAFSSAGHDVTGVDVDPDKVATINAGRSPVVEPGLDELISEGVWAGRVRATIDAHEAIERSELSLVCVGTPSQPNGGLDLTQVEKVSFQIGSCLDPQGDDHVVVLRSTMLPGSTEEVVVPTLEEASGRRLGAGLGVCCNPEFLREGSSLRDFFDPPFTLIGSSGDAATAVLRSLYGSIDPDPIVVPIRTAEMVKYVCNAFHALKVVFANEVGEVCKRQGIDAHDVMRIVCSDTKLNISPAYLTPGFAFGGSCLPKDVRALNHQAKRLDVEAPLLAALLPSNALQVDRVFQLIRRTGERRVGVLGMSFKPGTDDLRESPMVELIERLIGKGHEVRVHDPTVTLEKLRGANRAYIEREVPHIATLMAASAEDVVAASDVLVLGNADPDTVSAALGAQPHQTVIDLVRATSAEQLRAAYHGISW